VIVSGTRLFQAPAADRLAPDADYRMPPSKARNMDGPMPG
jgi:hypothetical protein